MSYQLAELKNRVDILVNTTTQTHILMAEGYATRYEFGATDFGNVVLVYDLNGKWSVQLEKAIFFCDHELHGLQASVEHLAKELPEKIARYNNRRPIGLTDAKVVAFVLYQAVMGIKLG